MSENTLRPIHPFLFFLSRVFILIGMVLVFTFAFLGIGMVLSKYIFQVDAVSNPSILNEFETNPYVLSALKLIQALNTVGGFLLPALLFPRALQQWPGIFNHSDIRPQIISIVISIVIMLAATPIVSLLIQWNEGFTFPAGMADVEMKLRQTQEAAEKLTRAFIHTSTIQGLMVNLVIVALLPAICEEFLFRGALMRFLMMCFRNKHIAVWVSGFVFSMMHGEFYGLIPRFILGVLLGYIAWYSCSIWPAVLAHFMNNSLALMNAHFEWNKSGFAIFDDSFVFPVYMAVISAALTIASVWMLKKLTIKTVYYNGE